jgi:hypothetical protein
VSVKATEEAAERVIASLDKEGKKLRGADWYELLQAVASRIECYEECYREENPEEFS